MFLPCPAQRVKKYAKAWMGPKVLHRRSNLHLSWLVQTAVLDEPPSEEKEDQLEHVTRYGHASTRNDQYLL